MFSAPVPVSWAVPLLLALLGWSTLGRARFSQGLLDLKKIYLSCTNVDVCFSEQKQTMRLLTPVLCLGRSGCEMVGSARGMGTDPGQRLKLDHAGDHLRDMLNGTYGRKHGQKGLCCSGHTFQGLEDSEGLLSWH